MAKPKQKKEQTNWVKKEVIPVVEEELKIGKRVVEKGGVRVRQEVKEEPVEKKVRLREEKVLVDRRPADRPLTNEDRERLGADVEVRTRGEEPVVAKQPHVVEEVVIGKKVSERDETIHDTVRKTKVDVERADAGKAGRANARAKASGHDYRGAGAIPQDLGRLDNLDDFELADDEPDPRGWDVEGVDGETIGSIDYLLASPSNMKVYFAVVDTGGWMRDKKFAIPMSIMELDEDDETAHVPFDRSRIKAAPEFRETDRDYNKYDAYWRTT